MSRKHTEMAIVYDFDGTLAPGNMQEHQFLPDIGIKPKAFWSEVDRKAKEHGGDRVLVYMNLMLFKARQAGSSVRQADFEGHGRGIKLFEGVRTWFERMAAYGREREVDVRHYLLSSGNAEILAGTPIAKMFAQVFASQFKFDANGVPEWPAQAVNYTAKTQYLFRINKGALDVGDDSKVNEFVRARDRAVPFENMIFVGDGPTDVPCFRLVKEKGGLSVAVFRPYGRGARREAEKLRKDGRVHCVVPAKYTEGEKLDRIVKAYIDVVAARAALRRLLPKDVP